MFGGVYNRNLFDKVRFPEGYWYEDMINNFIIRPQAKTSIDLEEVLYYKNSTKDNASKKTWKADEYKCLEHIYLIKSLAKDYATLGLTDNAYLFERIMTECSTLAVARTNKLDLETRKHVFLACCKLVEKYECECDFYKKNNKMQQFYKAFKNMDFKAWELASKLY